MSVNKTLSRSFLALLVLWIVLSACNDSPKRAAHIQIPDGYVGWVRIELGVPNTPALKTDSQGWELQKVPPSGLLQTSSAPDDMNAAAGRDYSYYSGDNLKPLPDSLINGWAMSNCFVKPDGSRLERKFYTFFVGPKAEYEKHSQELERLRRPGSSGCDYVGSLDGLPKVGNLPTAAG